MTQEVAESRVVSSDHVILTAAKLFRQKGYAASTTRELATMLGFQKASLYHYIKSKDDLLYAICERSLASITTQVREVLDGTDPSEVLRAVLEAHLRTSLEDRDLHAVMLFDMHCLPPEREKAVIAMRLTYERCLAEAISHAQEAGKIRQDIEVKYLALSLLNMLNWTIFWYSPEGEKTPKELADLFYTLYIDGAGVSR